MARCASLAELRAALGRDSACYLAPKGCGCILVMYSLLLSRGIDNVPRRLGAMRPGSRSDLFLCCQAVTPPMQIDTDASIPGIGRVASADLGSLLARLGDIGVARKK